MISHVSRNALPGVSIAALILVLGASPMRAEDTAPAATIEQASPTPPIVAASAPGTEASAPAAPASPAVTAEPSAPQPEVARATAATPETAQAEPARVEAPKTETPKTEAPKAEAPEPAARQAQEAPARAPAVVDIPPPALPAPVELAKPATPAATTLEPAHEQARELPASAPAAKETSAAAPAPVWAELVKAAVERIAREAPQRGVASLRKERDAVTAFYTAHGFAPLWIADGDFTPAARAALARLEHAADDGLDLKASPLPVLKADTDEARAAADVALSLAVVNYAREATGSRVDPLSINKLITEKPAIADSAQILANVSSAADADAALRNYKPQQPGYVALRDKLAELRHAAPAQPAHIGPGPLLKVGMKDPRVPEIRARFGLDTTPPATSSDDLLYDTRMASAVADFQRSHGLPASGQLTPRTVAALSGGDPAQLEAELIINMERWRWMSRSYAAERIEVNIPDFTVRLMRDGREVHRARVIVGKPTTPTPVFSNAMQFIEVNPYWNVPQSIIQKEMLPKIAADPTYLQRMGYEVTTARDGHLTVRQPPGERNALGRIKFMFPNQHAVYLHDTPTRGLFVNEKRAYSHGCVRVDQPFKFAELVLGKESGWTEDKVKKLIGGSNQTIRLPHNIEIHIEYFTAYVDQDGKLQLRDDIYGYSHKLKAALGLPG